MQDVPPRQPHPLPAPIRGTDLLGLWSVPRMGASRGWGQVGPPPPITGFGGGNCDYPPLYPPSPSAFFFRGGTKGRGVEGGPRIPRSSPPSPPPPYPRSMSAPGAAWISWVERWGREQVRGKTKKNKSEKKSPLSNSH